MQTINYIINNSGILFISAFIVAVVFASRKQLGRTRSSSEIRYEQTRNLEKTINSKNTRK